MRTYQVKITDRTFINDIYHLANICLIDCYGLDQKISHLVLSKIRSNLHQDLTDSILTDFIKKSKSFTSNITKAPLTPLDSRDALIQAPNFHELVFENDHYRILCVEVIPGMRVPFHLHQWKSLMIVLQAAPLEAMDKNGTIELDNEKAGVYEIEEGRESLSYLNFGNAPFIALSFEKKK